MNSSLDDNEVKDIEQVWSETANKNRVEILRMTPDHLWKWTCLYLKPTTLENTRMYKHTLILIWHYHMVHIAPGKLHPISGEYENVGK